MATIAAICRDALCFCRDALAKFLRQKLVWPFYLTAVVPLPRKQVNISSIAIRNSEKSMRVEAENLTEKISIMATILNFAFSTL